MGIAAAHGAVNLGSVGQVVEVQAHISSGLPRTTIVGLADVAVSEARDRVRSAVVNSGFSWPDQRITVGLSPASEQKRGSGLDFAIAMAILSADGRVVPKELGGAAFVGELGLDGSVRPVRAAVAMALALRAGLSGPTVFVSGKECGRWALIPGIRVVPVLSLAEAVAVLRGDREPRQAPDPPPLGDADCEEDLSDVQGQAFAGFALEVAAAGGHHLALTGPPGVGKSMLGRRLPGLLPDLSAEQLLEVASIQEIETPRDLCLSGRPPFQAPHHSASHVAMVGGASGSRVQPGVVSLAHCGVLLLDEVAEFRRETLEALRQPLEEGQIWIARAGFKAAMPARFQLIVTQNPCPCGDSGTPHSECRCTSLAKRRYAARLSGPLLDRIDIQLSLGQPVGVQPCAGSEEVQDRVREARGRLRVRCRAADTPARCTADVPSRLIRRDWPWLQETEDFLIKEIGDGGVGGSTGAYGRRLSTRGRDRLVRLCWTLADLAGRDAPAIDDAAIALRLRSGLG